MSEARDTDDPTMEAFIGLGSSIGDRVATLRAAVNACAALGDVRVVSRLYDTRPVGAATHEFVNAALILVTSLPPATLLERLKAIETASGRRHRVRWDDRTLDLDLLVVRRAGLEIEIDQPGLRVPHPRIPERDFVLAPLCDLDPHVRVRASLTAAEGLARLAETKRTLVRTRVETLVPEVSDARSPRQAPNALGRPPPNR